MKRTIARVLQAFGLVLLVLVVSVGGYAYVQCSRYDASMAKVYDVPLPSVALSTDPAVLARGKHLVESVAPCAVPACHGGDTAGGDILDLGPVGFLTAPNITKANLGAAYTDAELVRLLRHGIKKDGRSITFMPVNDFNWLPDADLVAIVSYLRTLPGVERPSAPMGPKTLGKVLDRRDEFAMDIARRIDHDHIDYAPAPAPTAEYGRYLARLCRGCHGETFSGGKLPGSPPSIPIPLDITPDPTGLAGWTFDDFDKVMRHAIRKNGKTLDPFMPVAAWKNFDDVEMHALWAYLQSLPPKPFGGR